ncbi:MAG: hypothetical protein ACJ75J_13075 [Cytophagaceae bacterium]
MIEKFFKAKHWQLFILTFGLPMLFQFIMMGTMIAKSLSREHPDPSSLFSYMKFFPLIMILFMAVFYSWFWSVAMGLQKKLPAHVTMKVRKFRIFFFIPVIYIASIILFGVITIGETMGHNAPPHPALIGGAFAIIMPMHLFSMFCMFYILYFTAKTLKTAELQKEVSFSDFAGEFFLIWFYPIGIWIIQPKINKMVEE